MLICGLDFETSGLNPETDKVVEVGCVLWDTELQRPVRITNCFVNHPGLVMTAEVVKIHGITDAALNQHGIAPDWALDTVLHNIADADIVCAHNGTRFDKPFLEAWCEVGKRVMPDKSWIDTDCDVEYDEAITTRKLSYLAAEHGFLNNLAHCAVGDVLTMLRILGRYDLKRVIELSQMPVVTLQALVDYDHNKLAKDRSYRWNPDRKAWYKAIKSCFVEKEQADCCAAGFKTRVIEEV